ncbi:uncharacterized protein LOC117338035 [Pecten maximus]|uniref:uncharacterized protein LOC117338035 n=1 Tax=Pecten maximus TaxID=6579 RepID=UPI0014581F0D|nr:uncharacterized protein LOC117338035 [Pecten maximus]
MAETRYVAGLISTCLLTCLYAITGVIGLVEEIPMPSELEECYKFRTQNISITDFVSEDINMFCITQFLYSTTHLRPQYKVANESILYAQELMRQVFGESYGQNNARRRHKRQIRLFPAAGRQIIRQPFEARVGPDFIPGLGRIQGLGQIPGQGRIPGLGQIPGQGRIPGLGQVPGQGRIPGLGQVPGQGRIPGLGQIPGQGPPILPRRPGRRWVRREVRSLSRREWVEFVNRINQLKRTPVGQSNRYDALADIHGLVVRSAHNGPNFPGWHRMYLAMFEQAIGVAIPYWDCRLDFYMRRPAESILWTDAYFGSGFGAVRSGPFANWITSRGTPLIRNVGSSGSLITDQMIGNVLSRIDINAITEPSAGPFTLERIHNAPHVYVDGHMSAPLTASYDPIFFLLHAFIDFIWSLYRQRQRLAGINPATSYPQSQDRNQAPGARMVPFNYRCIDGYSEFLERRVIYARPPSCPYCGRNAQCRRGRCVSVGGGVSRIPRRPGIFGSVFSSSASGNADTSSFGPKFQSDFNDPRNNRAKRDARAVRDEHASYNDIDTSQINVPYQNTFELNGKSSIDLWAFVPVKIIFERPPELQFKAYPIQNGNISREHDMFTPSTDQRLKQKQQATYKDCQVSGSGAAKVYVQTDGIDYSGRYKDYAVVDERLPVSSSITYVGVKNPTDGAAQLYMSAYDSCGRVCRPKCLTDKGYKPCSGALRVTSSFPKMYGITYEDAIKRNWMKNGKILPELHSVETPVVFSCEVQTTWSWS